MSTAERTLVALYVNTIMSALRHLIYVSLLGSGVSLIQTPVYGTAVMVATTPLLLL